MSFANPVVNAVIFQNISGEDWFCFIGFDSGWRDGVCCFHVTVAMIYSDDFVSLSSRIKNTSVFVLIDSAGHTGVVLLCCEISIRKSEVKDIEWKLS